MTLQIPTQTLYETDYLRWIETTVEKLRVQDYTSIDWENVIEEMADMGRNERRSLKGNLIIVLLHLLKWQFQPDRHSGSWAGSLVEHRRRIADLLSDSPSLKPYLETSLEECYRQAVKQAIAETQLSSEIFPPACPYPLAQVLDDDFLPDL